MEKKVFVSDIDINKECSMEKKVFVSDIDINKECSMEKKVFVSDIDDCLLTTDAVIIEINGKPNFSQFDEVDRLYTSIINQEVINMMRDHINNGYDIILLTARGTEDITKEAMIKVLSTYSIDIKECYAINDIKYGPAGIPKYIACKKRNIMSTLKSIYTEIEYIDDSQKNVDFIKALGVKAHVVRHTKC